MVNIMALSMKQNQQQRQKLTQEQSFFLDMLRFNKEELTDYLEKEYQENPLIDFDRRAFNKEGSSFEDNLLNVENNQAKETLQEHLLQQTGFFAGNVPGTIAEFLIYSVDHNGYLREESIAEVHNIFPQYTKGQVEEFIHCMQQMEPTGVFARNLQECMVLQLQESDSRYKKECIQIVEKHIRLLAENKLPEIGKAENISKEKVAECVKIIRCLNPKPGAQYAKDAAYLECEVEVLEEDENLTVKMLNNYEALQLRPEYYMTKDETVSEFVKPYLKRIRLLIDTLNARERTLFSIVSNIAEHQKAFFLENGSLQPFTLKKVAEELGMHESTISRAISNKSLRFKNREIPLKYFFVSQTVNGDSKDSVESKIRALVDTEDKSHPLSDQKICDLLKRDNVIVARRTIAKYREQMGILSASKRKTFIP